MVVLYPKTDINSQIKRVREENQRSLDSFSNSLAAQSKYEAYIRHLIANKENIPLAQQLVDSVLYKNPGNAYFLVLKGQIFDVRMQYDSALLEYDLAMQRDAFPYALDKRAKTYIKLGKYDLAIADYRSAFNRNFDYSYPLATLFNRLQQKDSALKYYLIFKKDHPTYNIEKTIQLLQK